MGGGVAEGFIEGAGERATFEHFFHDALGDFGKVVFHDAVDVLPEVAGGYGVHGGHCRGGRSGSGRCGGRREIYAKYREVFCPIDSGVFSILHGLVQEFCKASRVEVAQEFAVFLERVRHGICGFRDARSIGTARGIT